MKPAIRIGLLVAMVALQPAWGASEIGTIVLPAASSIVAEGDSLTYGLDATPGLNNPPINGSSQPRSSTPYPERLATLLPSCGPVVNRGYPGDRSVDGFVRWQSAKAGSLSLLMFGSNDALNYGRSATGVLTEQSYNTIMSFIIEKLTLEGSRIVILSPPPLQNPKADAIVEPFRARAKQLAHKYALPYIDTTEVLRGINPIWTADQVHLSEQSNIRLAEFVAQHIRCQ